MGKCVAILGLGKSGRAAADFFLNRGIEVWGIDKKAHELRVDKRLILCTEEQKMPIFDQLIISPGVSPKHFLCQQAKEVIGEIELACRYLKQKVLGVTGTNGKTTVTSLIAHVLTTAGLAAKAVGNIGEPLINFINDPSILVVELSSFQLETLKTPVFDQAAILNITPDHLERYTSFDEYAQAKFRIQQGLKKNAPLYLAPSVREKYPSKVYHKPIYEFGFSNSYPIFIEGTKLHIKENVEYNLPLRYKNSKCHDVENIMVAAAFAHSLGVSNEHFNRALSSFKKPPHRLEFVGSVSNVDFYNDSKGTNVDAVLKAVQALSKPIHLIAGGVDKGASYKPWVHCFRNKVRQIFAMGEAASRIKNEVSDTVNVLEVNGLDEGVALAYESAASGDIILLSPGCSSYDMFANFEERGHVFKQIVADLRRKE